MKTRCEAIVDRSEIYFYGHEQLFSGIADSIAVDDIQAVNGTIKDMFDSELFTKLQSAKLYRRLHQELWPEEQLPPLRRHKQHAQNEKIRIRVIDELCSQLRERIPHYSQIVARRRSDAHDFSVHPDDIPALARA
jgi:pyoverdine/dityrosine biosynthesis protein Dit1